jgi:transcriptional regulator with XRE-family HTH domain
VIKREVKLEAMLNSLIERGGYSRNRQPILDSINVTAAALSQYTCGRTRPSFDKLAALADFFHVSLDYLVYGEPASAPTEDPGPIARYVEQALMDVRGHTNRHSDMVARIGRLLVDRINDVAEEVINSRSAGIEGLIENAEILRVERHCHQADIMTADLDPNIITIEGDEWVRGQFFTVVTENLKRRHTYRFLLTGGLTSKSPIVIRLRELITQEVGGDRLHAYCFFRTASSPVASTTVLYHLDSSAFAAEEPAIFTQFSNYLYENTWLGYVNRPNSESTADMLMDPCHVERARKAFDVMWNMAAT